MRTYQIIELLQNTSGTKDKEQIVMDAYFSGNREFFIGAKMAYDPLVRFYVQKVPAIAEEDVNPEDLGTLTFNDFLLLSKKLSSRELTGNAARDAIADAATKCHGPTWNYFFRRVLRKDLQCGVTDTIINKVLKKLSKNGSDPEAEALIIPIFECQLAKDGEHEDHKKKIKGKKLCDYKLDGVRLLSVLDKQLGTVSQFTRNGLPNDNFPHIRADLEKLMAHIPNSIVLDGEVVSKSFQELMTQVNRKENIDASDAKLALFDIIPLNDFRHGICKVTQEHRHRILSELQISGMMAESKSVYVLPKLSVDLDTEDGKKSFYAFIREAADNEVEGIMVKDPDAFYESKRTANWLKIKPFITCDLTIIGFEEGKPDGKYVGTTGAIICSGIDGDKEILVKVGSGISDQQRDDFWKNQEKLIGSLVEIKADCFTLERGETVYSLRFPRFVRFREAGRGEGKI